MKLSLGVKALIIANAILFVFTHIIPDRPDGMYHLFALYFPGNDYFQAWQMITTMFMHGSIAHIFFNMFALSSFGSALEFRWGLRRFLTFYFLAGIGASLIYTLVNQFKFNEVYEALALLEQSPAAIQALLDTGRIDPKVVGMLSEAQLTEFVRIYHTPVVGASGAVYGVLVAFGILYPNAKLSLIFFPVPVAAKYFIPGLLCLDLFSGVTGFSLFGGGIAHFAHIGGAVIGFLLMMFWREIAPKRTATIDSVSDLD